MLEEKGIKFTLMSSPIVAPLTASVSNVSNDLLKRFDEAQIIRVRILYCMMHGRMCANLDGC